MSFLKKILITSTIGLLSLTPMQTISAQAYRTDTGGNGYLESQRAPSIAAGATLAAIGLAAIIAVAVQNQGHKGHSHCHSASSRCPTCN